MRTLDTLDVAGRTVFVRVDFNVPLSPDGSVADDSRISATLPTLARLREGAARKLVLASSLGRPKGVDPKLSMRPVVGVLSRLLGVQAHLLPFDLYAAEAVVRAAPDGSVLVLENTRYYEGEARNDPELADQLARLADAYVNDGFGVVHRAHASVASLPRRLPSAAGLLLEREVRELGRLLGTPPRPFVAVLGGAKVSDKLGVIESLLPRVDALLLGGAMANTFLAARGGPVGTSLMEPDLVPTAAALLAGEGGSKVGLPVDLVVAPRLDREDAAEVVPSGSVPPGRAAYDIGPATVDSYAATLLRAGTVFWNGPMGVYERPRFAEGTVRLAEAVAESGGHTVVGGGDSLAAVRQSGVEAKIGHLSTGGGASLQFLEGRPLPGIQALGGSRA